MTGEGTPIETERTQEEINKLETYYADTAMSEGRPVKIAYIDDQPFVVTGAVSAGRGKWSRVIAWPVLPIENVHDRRVKNCADAQAEFDAADASDQIPEFSYQDIQINCGSVKKPQWWVIVGPETVFTVRPEPKKAKGKAKTEESAPSNRQINEHGVYVQGVGNFEIPMPKKAGKTRIEIRVVQDVEDGLWRSAFSGHLANLAGSGSLPSVNRSAYQSRDLAIGAAGQNAKEFLSSQLKPGAQAEAIRRQVRAAIAALDNWIVATLPDGAETASPVQPKETTLEDALKAALSSYRREWTTFQHFGATDAELLAAIGEAFSAGTSLHSDYSWKGGKKPQFSWKEGRKMTAIFGEVLVAKAREVLKIGLPARSDDFTAPRCDECRRIDGAHSRDCSKSSAAAAAVVEGKSKAKRAGKRR